VDALTKDPNTNTIMFSLMSLGGAQIALMEGAGKHGHKLDGAISFVVNCKNQAEVDYYWDALVKGGGKHSQCGWLIDKFGVHWQIVPAELEKLMEGDKAEKVMAALLKMQKVDIAKLQQARN
ncbi:MAG: VOC family protein, partial [Bdellovibrionia bacterium]